MTPAPTESPGRGLTIELTRDAGAPAQARAAIEDFCAAHGVAPGTVATLQLLVSEVVTNAVVHPDVDRNATITLRAWPADGAVRVEVRDDGPRFTPRPRDPDRVAGGFGLYLVEREAVRWGVAPGPTTTVWFEVAERAA
ncbi:MAG TPA: ATP-binding protein [Solirubrobacteraceae bacterium]|nr:ATP-binding protein [Solirubrobacteraceae bacterium]